MDYRRSTWMTLPFRRKRALPREYTAARAASSLRTVASPTMPLSETIPTKLIDRVATLRAREFGERAAWQRPAMKKPRARGQPPALSRQKSRSANPPGTSGTPNASHDVPPGKSVLIADAACTQLRASAQD